MYTELSGYALWGTGSVTELTEVLGIVVQLSQNSQKYRVLWCNCHRTHGSIGHCGTTVTELTEVQGNVVLRSQNSQGNPL